MNVYGAGILHLLQRIVVIITLVKLYYVLNVHHLYLPIVSARYLWYWNATW